MVVALWRRRNGAGRPWKSRPCGAGRRAYSDTGSPAAVCCAACAAACAPAAAASGMAGPEARAAIGGSVSSSRRPRPTLARRCSSDRRLLLRMLVFGLAARLADLVLGRHRQLLELRHPRRADRRTLGCRRDEGPASPAHAWHRRRLGLREQRGLRRDRADRDVAIGAGCIGAGSLRHGRNGGGDGGERGALDVGAARRWTGAAAGALAGHLRFQLWARSAMRWLSARSRAVRSARRLSARGGQREPLRCGAVRAGRWWPALRAIAACSMPVATTETRIMPSRVRRRWRRR